jgi:hypothetical protein
MKTIDSANEATDAGLMFEQFAHSMALIAMEWKTPSTKIPVQEHFDMTMFQEDGMSWSGGGNHSMEY